MDVEINQVPASRLNEVHGLAYREYLRAGYIAPRADEMLSHYHGYSESPATTVLGAYTAGELVGTCSLTADGRIGLPGETDFRLQIGRVRRWCQEHGLKLGASWRLVTAGRVRQGYRIMLDLVRAIIRKNCELGIHVTLSVVHPQHCRAYQRIVGMETIAAGGCGVLGGRTASLMMADSRATIKRCVKRRQPCLRECSPPRWPDSTVCFNPLFERSK